MTSTMRELPAELERDIFELAARNQLCKLVDLILVAQRVKLWMEPIAVETMVLNTRAEIARFCRVVEMPQKRLVSHFIRSLCIPCHVSEEAAHLALQRCQSVEKLAFWSSKVSDVRVSYVLDLITQLPLHSYSTHGYLLPRLFLTPCVWHSRLTCLDIVLWGKEETMMFSILPNLTHVCLSMGCVDDMPEFVEGILRTVRIPPLRVLAISRIELFRASLSEEVKELGKRYRVPVVLVEPRQPPLHYWMPHHEDLWTLVDAELAKSKGSS